MKFVVDFAEIKRVIAETPPVTTSISIVEPYPHPIVFEIRCVVRSEDNRFVLFDNREEYCPAIEQTPALLYQYDSKLRFSPHKDSPFFMDILYNAVYRIVNDCILERMQTVLMFKEQDWVDPDPDTRFFQKQRELRLYFHNKRF